MSRYIYIIFIDYSIEKLKLILKDNMVNDWWICVVLFYKIIDDNWFWKFVLIEIEEGGKKLFFLFFILSVNCNY